MATSTPNSRFQSWLLDRMVEFGFTPMSLAKGLGILDGLVEDWVAGRTVPSAAECQHIAQLFEVPVRDVRQVAGLRS
jgi:transcriptional regulator with XRE-family HTH domain